MSNRLTLSLSAVLAMLVFVFHLSAKSQPPEDTAEMLAGLNKPLSWQGKLAPDFELELLDGETFRLSENIGEKVIILNFFATWCGPCKQEMPELVYFCEKHKDEPFLLIGIDSNESRAKVQDFVIEQRVAFPVGIDRRNHIQSLYGVQSFPTTVFIGADGTIQLYEIGPVMNADVAFGSLLEASLATIRSGQGIDRETYFEKSNMQESLASHEDDEDADELRGRARTIAETMICPCGCSDKVIECNCNTAKNIKERLRGGDFSGKTDAEVIRELNKEFCVGDDKG